MGSCQLAGFNNNGIDSSGFVTKKLETLKAFTINSNWVYNWIFLRRSTNFIRKFTWNQMLSSTTLY